MDDRDDKNVYRKQCDNDNADVGSNIGYGQEGIPMLLLSQKRKEI